MGNSSIYDYRYLMFTLLWTPNRTPRIPNYCIYNSILSKQNAPIQKNLSLKKIWVFIYFDSTRTTRPILLLKRSATHILDA